MLKSSLFIAALIGLLMLSGCSRTPEGMVLVPEGKFKFGSSLGEADDGPEREVSLESFYIDIYEVTNGEYKKFVKATGHREPKDWVIQGYNDKKASHPVVFVRLEDARSFCDWAGKRLPTEEEWEKAARGVDGNIYPFGMDFDPDKANTSLSGIVGTTEVGSYPEGTSPYGLFDMAGNVWEWTDSDYGKGRFAARGGSWGLSHRFARTFSRVGYAPDVRINNLGFRCAKDS